MNIDRVTVDSHTSTLTYVVTFVGNEPVACTCPHYNFRSAEDTGFSCKHMRSAEATRPLSQADLVRVRRLLNRGLV